MCARREKYCGESELHIVFGVHNEVELLLGCGLGRWKPVECVWTGGGGEPSSIAR